MRYIQGQPRNQITLFPESLEEYISEDNPVRIVDAYVESLNLRVLGFTKSIPAETGRPAYPPGAMLKLGLYGYMNRIRSSRRQKAECHRNVEVMWLIDKLTPDHRSIARFRSENAKALKEVFKDFTKLCLKLNLYGKELAAIDGSKFEAVNANDANFNQQKLADRIARIDKQISEYMQQLEEEDIKEEGEKEKTTEEISQIIQSLQERKSTYEQYKEDLKSTGQTQKSLTDPDSRRMKSNDRSDMSYNVQISVDSKHNLIADYAVTNEASDKRQLSKMAKSSTEILEADNLAVTADTGYDTATEVAECIMAGITPHVAGADYDICIPATEDEPIPIENEPIPIEDEPIPTQPISAHHNGRHVLLKGRNIALCPMGNILYPSSYISSDGSASYRNSEACANCKQRCTNQSRPKEFRIRMPRKDFSKEYDIKGLRVKQVRVRAEKSITRKRKSIAEHPFGTIKRNMDAGYVLTKGLTKVTGEFALTCLAYNLKRVINILGVKPLLDFLHFRFFAASA